MSRNHHDEVVDGATRRQFLAATGAAILATGGSPPAGRAKAAATATLRRSSLSDPANARNVMNYERGVAAMLALPPTDPRNWYRYAMIHLLDCPHRNWWFLPWHRGYIGWLEMIIRGLVPGASDFALPYWDWTTQPRLPEAFLNGKLNPANFAIPGFTQFKAQFEKPLSDYFSGLNAAQLAQLKARGYADPDSVWASIEHAGAIAANPSIFSDIANVRGLNPPNSPNFGSDAASAVALATILDALGPRQFTDFSSGKAATHQQAGTEMVLESQPHDMVHGEVGGGGTTFLGFMSAFLSPIDPIFFMHHTNLDRLWDVWTRKQIALGQQAVQLGTGTAQDYPTAPVGADLDAWNSEPFLFFVGADGKFVAQAKSGDYSSMSLFAYHYQPGSGEVVVPRAPTTVHDLAGRSFAASMMDEGVAKLAQPSVASSKVPGEVFAAAGQANGLRVIAEITAEFPANAVNMQLHVLVNVPPGTRSVDFRDPHYAGTYRPFGLHHHGGMEHGTRSVTFNIGLTNSIQKLTAAGLLGPNDEIKVSVVPDLPGIELDASVKVTMVVLKTF
jgi:hypothetical protein